jgi:peptidoglycan/xylan/chitin deacetylase (PgdA/CDA1 family)
MDQHAVRDAATRGFEIGAHTRTHPRLPAMSPSDLAGEIGGSRNDLLSCGVPCVRLFTYPYGECDERITEAVRVAGFEAAFTVEPGWAQPNGDCFAIPRIEILRSDVGLKLQWKVAMAGPLRRRHQSWTEAVRNLWQRWPVFSRVRLSA